MNTYTTVRNRLLQLLGEHHMSIHKLAMESAVPPSSIKNILYGKSQNPGKGFFRANCQRDTDGVTAAKNQRNRWFT